MRFGLVSCISLLGFLICSLVLCILRFSIKMADVEKDAVVARLKQLSLIQLEEVCTTLNLNVPAVKKTKHNSQLTGECHKKTPFIRRD